MVPLLYEGRHVEQRVDPTAIDSWFERVFAGLSEKEKADLKRKYAKTARLFQTAQAISMIAFDVSQHFNWTWKGTGFKGQLVAPRNAPPSSTRRRSMNLERSLPK